MSFLDSTLTLGPWPRVVLIQVTLVALLGCLAWLAARRGRPALRGAILLAALLGLLLVPGFASVTPVWLPLPQWVWRAGAESPTLEPDDVVPATPPSPTVDPAVFAVLVEKPSDKDKAEEDPTKPAGDIDLKPVKAEAVLLNFAVPAEVTAPPASPSKRTRHSWTLGGVLAGIWLLGAIVYLSRALLRLALLYRCSWKARPVREQAWTDCLASLARGHGLPAVALRESRALASPLTLGLFWPVILLPRNRSGWPAEQRVLILEHELAHVRRRDFVAGLVAEAAVCLCWFHPLVRWLAGRLRLEQEYAADAWAASTMADPTDYLRCLARLALEQDRGHGPLAPAFWRRRPEIMRRIDMLRQNPKGLSTRLGKRAGWTVAALTAATCLAVAGVGPLRSDADGQQAAPASETKAKPTMDAQGDPLPDGALARLGTTRMRHGAEVTFVAFGPRGETLLTAGRDNTIRLWDLTTGKEIRRFARPKPANPKPDTNEDKAKKEKARAEDAVLRLMGGGGNNAGSPRVALSPDGKILAVGSGNIIQLYDLETGKDLRQLQGLADGAAGLLFSPDGRTLAARTADGTLFFWDANTGKEIRQIKPPPRPRNNGVVLIVGGNDADTPGMSFTPDGKILAAAAADRKDQDTIHSVKFWDLATGNEIRRINPPGKGAVNVVAITPDGEMLAYVVGNIVHLCAVKTGKELRQLKMSGGGISTLSFTPDGKTLVVRGRSQWAGLWDTQTGKQLHKLSEAQPREQTGGLVLVVNDLSSPEVRNLAIAPDGKRVASASGSTVRLWETTTGKEVILAEGHRRTPSILALSRDGKTVISWGADRVIRRWDAASGKSLGAFAAPSRTTRAALSTDGRTVALANADNTIRLHDAATGKELHRMKTHANGIAALSFSPDGKLLASRGSADNSIRIYEVAAGRELRQIVLKPGRDTNRGTVIFLGGSGGGSASGAGLAFTPDAKLLVVPGPGDNPGKTLLILDVDTGKELRRIESPQPVSSLAISPDGRTLATENADRTITLWEIACGKRRVQLGKLPVEVVHPKGHQVQVMLDVDGLGGGFNEPAGPVGLAFSHDGHALAARSADRSVCIWDVNTAKEIGRFAGHGGRTETVAFASDDKTLASGATDTTILLWDAANTMKEPVKEPAVELPSAEAEQLWGDLAGDDAAKAFLGVRKLTAAPTQAVPLLGARLKPAGRIDPRKIDGWIGELESEKYAVRQAAAANLIEVGTQALPALRKVLASSPALETRKRVEELVQKLTDGTLTAEQLRLVRSIEILERIANADARRILRTLAQGAPETLPTREAESALHRLAGQPAAQH